MILSLKISPNFNSILVASFSYIETKVLILTLTHLYYSLSFSGTSLHQIFTHTFAYNVVLKNQIAVLFLFVCAKCVCSQKCTNDRALEQLQRRKKEKKCFKAKLKHSEKANYELSFARSLLVPLPCVCACFCVFANTILTSRDFRTHRERTGLETFEFLKLDSRLARSLALYTSGETRNCSRTAAEAKSFSLLLSCSLSLYSLSPFVLGFTKSRNCVNALSPTSHSPSPLLLLTKNS